MKGWLDVTRADQMLAPEDWHSVQMHRLRLVARDWRTSAEQPRVLVVEDDATTREAMADALAEEAFSVVAVRDGSDALALAAKRHPDVIVLDLGLPNVDGVTFAKRWSAQASTAVPIIVVSGLRDAAEMAQAIGAAAFFEKPFDMAHLAGSIRRLAYNSVLASIV